MSWKSEDVLRAKYGIIEVLNTEKSPGYLRRLTVIPTSAKSGVNSQVVVIIIPRRVLEI